VTWDVARRAPLVASGAVAAIVGYGRPMGTQEPAASLRLEGIDGKLTIHVLSREAADPTDPYWDANWLTTSVEVGTPHLSAGLRAALKADEFAEFLVELRRLAAGDTEVARFRSIEGWLSLDVSSLEDGVLVGGVAKAPLDPANELRFAIAGIRHVDVPGIADDVERILEAFPVLGRRDQ
jgi:hypothetical protein